MRESRCHILLFLLLGVLKKIVRELYIGVEYDVNKVTGQVLADDMIITMVEYEMAKPVR